MKKLVSSWGEKKRKPALLEFTAKEFTAPRQGVFGPLALGLTRRLFRMVMLTMPGGGASNTSHRSTMCLFLQARLGDLHYEGKPMAILLPLMALSFHFILLAMSRGLPKFG